MGGNPDSPQLTTGLTREQGLAGLVVACSAGEVTQIQVPSAHLSLQTSDF